MSLEVMLESAILLVQKMHHEKTVSLLSMMKVDQVRRLVPVLT